MICGREESFRFCSYSILVEHAVSFSFWGQLHSVGGLDPFVRYVAVLSPARISSLSCHYYLV